MRQTASHFLHTDSPVIFFFYPFAFFYVSILFTFLIFIFNTYSSLLFPFSFFYITVHLLRHFALTFSHMCTVSTPFCLWGMGFTLCLSFTPFILHHSQTTSLLVLYKPTHLFTSLRLEPFFTFISVLRHSLYISLPVVSLALLTDHPLSYPAEASNNSKNNVEKQGLQHR